MNSGSRYFLNLSAEILHSHLVYFLAYIICTLVFGVADENRILIIVDS